MNDFVVVDASLVVKWLLREIYSDKALALAQAWINAQVRPVAPYFMPIEVSNALHKRVVLQEFSVDTATWIMERMMGAGIEQIGFPGIHSRAIELASQLQQGASYDTHYLALAEFMHCDLWTADERFYRAAIRYYPTVHWIGEV